MSQSTGPVKIEEIMQKPGPLWRLTLLVKEIQQKDSESGHTELFLVAVEADRGIGKTHAIAVIDMAREWIADPRLPWQRHDSSIQEGQENQR
jgi:hypothetical protein